MTLRQWLGLWPVIAVWAFMVLPYLAFSAPTLLREVADLPWWLRAGLWVLVRTWPYTKVAKLSVALETWPPVNSRLARRLNPGFPVYIEEQLELDLGGHVGDS